MVADVRVTDIEQASIAENVVTTVDLGAGPVVRRQSMAAHAAQLSTNFSFLTAVKHVASRSFGTPPVAPPDGTIYIVPTTGLTGSFVGHENDLATYHSSTTSYTFDDPTGATALILDEGVLAYFDAGAWFVGTGISASIELLTSVAGGPTAFTANATADFAMTVGRLFIFTPNVACTVSPTLNVTPSGGPAIGAKVIFDFDSTAIQNGGLEAGVPYLCMVRSATTFQTLARLGKARAEEFNVYHTDGRIIGRITFSGGNLRIKQSSDGTEGGLFDAVDFSPSTGKARFFKGVLIGETGGTSADVYSPFRRPDTGAENLRQAEHRAYHTLSSAPNCNESWLPATLSSATPYYLSIADALRGGLRVTTASGKIDARFLIDGASPLIYTTPGASAAVCIGDGNTFVGGGAGNIMASFPSDTLFRITRVGDTTFAYEVVAGSAPTLSATPRWIAAKTIVFSGQSLAATGVNGAFFDGIRKVMAEYGNTDDIYFVNGAYSGSALIEGNADIANWWWINFADDNPGPRALAWKAEIDAAVALGQPSPSVDLQMNGQQDIDNMVTVATGVSSGATTYPFFVAKQAALNAWKQAQYAGLKIILYPLGADDNKSGLGDLWRNAVRLAQLKAIRGIANTYQGIDYYELPRPDQSITGLGQFHLTFGSQAKQGERLAIDILAYEYGTVVASTGPYINSVTEIDPNTYAVEVHTGYGTAALSGRNGNPTSVYGFGLYSNEADPMARTRYAIDEIRYSGDGLPYFTFTIKSAEASTGAVVVYPDGACALGSATRDVIWQTSPPYLPLRSRDIGP